jgi:signal transduction histidine kinase
MRAWRSSGPLHDLAVPIAAGVAAPLFLYRTLEGGEPVAALAAVVLGSASAVIALWSLAGSEASRLRQILRAGAALLAVTATVPRALALLSVSVGSAVLAPALLSGVCITGSVVVALASLRGRAADSIAPLEQLFAGGSVGMAWLSVALSGDGGLNPLPLAGWLAVSAIGGLGGLRPLLSRADRSRLERDIFAEAIEAQRSMIAADLHDDVLQDLAHLVRRLDQGGDAESTRLARDIADRLRDLTYELRLPLLDDLGVGPALEWFAGRLERLRGVRIDYEHLADGRPPTNVELAFFRVGQEALTNAVKHGRQPIVLRYEAAASCATLSVRDAGPGLAADVPFPGGRHLGLVSMRQRAEMIGARLAIGDADGGGTLVTMEWETA